MTLWDGNLDLPESDSLHDLKYLVPNSLESVIQNTRVFTLMEWGNLAPAIPGFVGSHRSTERQWSSCRRKVL